MMNQLPVEQCRFCGGRDIRVGWQQDALVTFKRNGLLGNRLKFLICRNCGAILYQCVAEPHCFRLAKEDRKLLLRLVDMEDNLRGQATLHSFTCGYRLACGIHRELAEEPAYSFAKEEEERACRKAQPQDENNSTDATPNQ